MAGSGLATVMFTDLIGSTRMRDRLGDDIADEIGVEHDRIIGDALSSTGGRLVKNLGDGALAVFDSSVDAVVAGQRIQEGVSLYNRQADETRHIGVRIGINAGEIATDDGDVIGLPVAIASRVCAEAEGGQILITDTVRLLIGRRARFPYVSVGAPALKGVENPIELWSIEEPVTSETPTGRGDAPFPAFLARGTPRSLVGRDEQLAQLDAIHTATTAGASLVAVIGEPGIGKTSLTSTWCRTAADNGATVVGGRCTPDAALPYEPFIEIARGILESYPERLSQVGPVAGNIAQLIPGIQQPHGLPAPIQVDPDTTLYLMSEAFATLLAPTNGTAAILAVLDDLHWADEQSVGVLSRLARKDDLPVMFLGTYRDTDLVRSHPLPTLLSDLRRERRLERITLQRLSKIDIEQMISGRFGAKASPELVGSIAEETQGNPFFVEEITTHLQDEGAINNAGKWVSDIPIEEYGVPEGIRDVVGRRLGRLGEDAVATLEVAAVIGPSFSIDVAGSLADLSERDIDRVVDIAMGARMITEGDSADSFSFTHALLRQTLYDDLPTRRRTRLHRSVAEALEERNAPAPVLLSHWLKAERPSKALAAAIRSADESERAFAGTDIASYLELALDLWDDSDHPEEATGGTRVELVCRLASALADFGRQYDQALDLVNAELATDVTDDDSRALLYRELALAYSRQGIATLSSEALREALDLSRNTDRADIRLKVLGSYSGNLMMNDQSEEAIKAAREAIAIAADLDAEMQLYAPYAMLATALAQIGELEEALEYFDVALDISQASGNLTVQLIVYANKGEMLWVNGRMADALEFTEDAIAKVSELGVPTWLGTLHGNALLMLFDLGRWDDAARHLNDYRYDKADHTDLHLAVCGMRIAAERGDRAAMETALQQASMHNLSEVYPEFQGRYWDSYVSDLRWQCQLQEAFDAAVSSLDILGGRNAWMHATRLTALGIEVAADGVEAGVADQGWLNAASDWLDRFSVYHPTISFAAQFKATASADYARATGNNDAELWRTAVDAWEDHPYYRAKTKWRLAQSLAETDPSDPEITELLDQAHLAAEDLGARPLLDAIESTRENPSQ